MTDPVNVIVDRIPLPSRTDFIEYFNETLYCTGTPTRRINLRTKQITEIDPAVASFAIALIDYHRPFSVPPDVVGSGAPDGKVYVTTNTEFHVFAIVPPLLDQVTKFKVVPDSASRPFLFCMAIAHSGKYLYVHDWNALTVGIVDVVGVPRTIGAFQLDARASSMVISPDDRFIYAAHPYNNFVSVIDTSAWPPSVRKVPVVNGPFGLALSADGKRLFVAQDGDSGTGDPSDLHTGTLSVFETATMQGVWQYTGAVSYAVTLNSTGTRAYVSNNGAGTVSVVDVSSTPEVIGTITGFVHPGPMRISADDRRLYVLESGGSYGIGVAAVG